MTDSAARTGAFTADSLPARYESLLGPYLFKPWAEVLLDCVAMTPGASVIDVASGTGIAARAAARRAGPRGHVLATDISPAMIAFNAAHPPLPGSAPIETAVAPVTDLGGSDGRFDVALCQQGLPFFPDRPGAVRELHRVLRPGGVIGVAVWTPGHDVAPFGVMSGALRDVGAPEPFPDAYDESSYVLGPGEVSDLLTSVGFHDVESAEADLVTEWPNADALHRAMAGTPFGAALEALDEAKREQVRRLIAERVAQFEAGGRLEIPTYSVIARATA